MVVVSVLKGRGEQIEVKSRREGKWKW